MEKCRNGTLQTVRHRPELAEDHMLGDWFAALTKTRIQKCYIAGSISHVAYIIKSNKLTGGRNKYNELITGGRVDYVGVPRAVSGEANVKTKAKFGVGGAPKRCMCVRGSDEP